MIAKKNLNILKYLRSIVNMVKNCSVFGHSKIEITKELEDKLFATFEDLIKQGCKYFYFGGFGEFDNLCHKVISKLKANYPHIQRFYCLSDPTHLRVDKRTKWLKKEDYEEFVYLDLDFDWWYTRIYYRNCAMIDRSDVVVFYVEEKNDSGAYKAFKYAKQNKKIIVNMCNSIRSAK